MQIAFPGGKSHLKLHFMSDREYALLAGLATCGLILVNIFSTQMVLSHSQIVEVASSDPKCDPSYPDICIASPPPDLDCGDVPYNDIKVVGNDPHGFDREGDGIGCEG